MPKNNANSSRGETMAPVAIYTTSSNNKKITNEIASAVINSIAYSTVNKKEFMPLRIYHEGEKHGPYESLPHQGSGPRHAINLFRRLNKIDGAIGLGEVNLENSGAPAIKVYSTLNFKNTNSFYRHLYTSAEEKLGMQYRVQLEYSDACKEWILPEPALSNLEGKISNMVFGLSRIGDYLKINEDVQILDYCAITSKKSRKPITTMALKETLNGILSDYIEGEINFNKAKEKYRELLGKLADGINKKIGHQVGWRQSESIDGILYELEKYDKTALIATPGIKIKCMNGTDFHIFLYTPRESSPSSIPPSKRTAELVPLVPGVYFEFNFLAAPLAGDIAKPQTVNNIAYAIAVAYSSTVFE
jgi:hypothetical protein